jgi:hypothetical protein
MTDDAEIHAAGPGGELPAPSKPKARERGRMRRRLRAQARVREALLLDLGATVWELHRHGRREAELLQAKASHLAAVDDEVRGLAQALHDGDGIEVLAASGRVAVCAHCASLLTPSSRYCSECGRAAAVNGSPAPGRGAPPDDAEAQTEIVETPLPAAPGTSPQPAGGPSLRRRVGERMRGTPPR